MTFFANSGIAWPNLDEATRKAGQQSLEASGEFWKILAELEAGEPVESPEHIPIASAIPRVAAKFRGVAIAYFEISEKLDDLEIEPLSPAEFRLAAINPAIYATLPNYPGYSEPPWIWRLSVKRLYRELADWMHFMERLLTELNPSQKREDMAPHVFEMMHHWEIIATLGRLIAVVNRRKQKSFEGYTEQ